MKINEIYNTPHDTISDRSKCVLFPHLIEVAKRALDIVESMPDSKEKSIRILKSALRVVETLPVSVSIEITDQHDNECA